MKKTTLLFSASLLTFGTSHAAILSLDFGTAANGTEAGFTAQNGDNVTHTTVAGDINVTFTGEGGFFRRGALANSLLHEDFVYVNGDGTFTMTLSGAGISASTDYELTFFSFDNSGNANVTAFDGVSGTVGSTSISWNSQQDPTGLYDPDNFSVATFTSDGTGNITIDITEPSGTSGDAGRLNGLIIAAVPEPSSTALLGLGGLALILRRRR